MAIVQPAPLHAYNLRIIPLNWQMVMPHQKIQRAVAYFTRRLCAKIDAFGLQKKPYHEQCEAARMELQELFPKAPN